MASNPEQKPKRTPIVLNMHLLYEDEKVAKESKDSRDGIKDEKSASDNAGAVAGAGADAVADADAGGDEKGKGSDNKDISDNKGVGGADKNSSSSDIKAKMEGSPNGPNKGARKGDGSKDDRVCWDFMRNMCNRGDSCKFEHPAPSNVSAADRRRRSWLTLCHDYQNGLCRRTDCRYFHISRDDESMYRKTGEIHPQVVDQVMRKALYIDLFGPGVRPSCKEFLKGNCNLPTCRFRHLDRREYEDEVFRCLQEEFEIVFGPPDKRGSSPFKENSNYNRNQYRNNAWFESTTPAPERYDNPPAGGNMQGSLPRQDMGYEPDAKRRRHYSNERSFQYPADRYRLSDGMDYDRRASYGPADNVEMERMMQEINNLRNDKMEITRRMDREVLTLRDEIAHLTRENETLRQENTYMRSIMSDSEMSSKNAMDSLMKTNDNLVEDNKCLKTALQKAENDLAEAKKEKNVNAASLASAKEAEQKMKLELQKVKEERESLVKIRNDLKAELERSNQQAKTNQSVNRNEPKKEVKDDRQNTTPASGRLGTGLIGNPPASNNSGNTVIPPLGINQQQKGPNPQQHQPPQSQPQPQSLLGEFPQNTSLLGLHPPFAGAAVIKALSEFGASRIQIAQQALVRQLPLAAIANKGNSQQNGQQLNPGPNQRQMGQPSNQGPGQAPSFGSNQGSSGRSDYNANQGPGGRSDYGANQGPGGRADYAMNQGPGARSTMNQGPGGRSDYNSNQGPGGQSNYSSNQGPDGRSDYGPNKGPGDRVDYGSNQGPGGRSNYGSNQGYGGRSDYGPPQGPGGRSDYGSNQGPGGRPDYGSNQGPGGRSDYSSNQGSVGRSDYSSSQGSAGRSDYGPAGRSDFGSNPGSGGRSDYGSNQGPAGRSDYNSNQGPGGRSDYGASQGPDGRSDYGASQGPAGRSDYGASQGPAGRSDYGTSQGPGGRSDYGASQGAGGRSDYSGQSGYGSSQSRGGLWASDYGLSRSQNDQRTDFGSGRGGSWGGDKSLRSDTWRDRSDGPSRSGYLGSEKDSYLSAPGSRLGERDYGLSGYDSRMRDSSFGSGKDMHGGSSSSLRSSWFREEDARLGAGRMPY